MPELYELFIRCFGAAIEQLPDVASTTDIHASVIRLIDLFRSLSRPGNRELAGLWGELFVISMCKDPAKAVRAWHADPYERFDFSLPGSWLEVKSTLGEERQHEFGLEQLQLPTTGQAYVASLLLQPLTGGVSVVDLATSITSMLVSQPKLREKVWENVASALGIEFSERLDRRFDPQCAERGLRVFSALDIPAPDAPADPRVTRVRFRTDLSTVHSSVAGSAIDALNDFFA
ncbi:PD-(D/E)XK motif protein [Chitinimonas viridis]|uniref:PD-(D/E)XK motif protein n=1 Tax=Chitinimonas viridis TaxID=664880 RepID=UPI003570DFBD